MAREYSSKNFLSYCRVGDMDRESCGGAKFHHHQKQVVNPTVEKIFFFPLPPFWV